MTSMIGNSGMRGPTGGSSGKSLTGGNVIPKGYREGQMQQFTPEQMQLFQQMFGQLGPDSYLGKLAGGDQSTFEQLEAPAMQQFQGLQGQLASRFSGMGTGARRSSGFQNASSQATSDFAQSLQSQRMGLQNQAMRDLYNMSSGLLSQRPYEQFLIKKQPGFWKKLLMSGLEHSGEIGKIFGEAMQENDPLAQYNSQGGQVQGGQGKQGGGGMDMSTIMEFVKMFAGG